MHRIGDIVLIKDGGVATYEIVGDPEDFSIVGKILCKNRHDSTHKLVRPHKIIENLSAGYRANVTMPHIIQELFLL